MSKQELAEKNKKVASWLIVAALGVFAFGFALVPLYDVFCQVTGINGKTNPVAVAPIDCTEEMATGREITIRFVTSLNKSARDADLDFGAQMTENKMVVNPCEVYEIGYFMENHSDEFANVQAIPSVSPGQAAKFFQKPLCFCWNSQNLNPGERLEMPVRFFVDPALYQHINTITVNYTLFKTGRENPEKA